MNGHHVIDLASVLHGISTRTRRASMKASAGRVLMLVENNFPADTRVRNEARTLTDNGYKVTVICLRAPGEAGREVVDGVTVYRIPRLTLFKKLPDANSSLVRRIVHKLLVVVGYVYRVSATSRSRACCSASTSRREEVRRRSRPQSAGYARHRHRLAEAARQEVGLRSPRSVAGVVSVTLQDHRGHHHAGACGSSRSSPSSSPTS